MLESEKFIYLTLAWNETDCIVRFIYLTLPWNETDCIVQDIEFYDFVMYDH